MYMLFCLLCTIMYIGDAMIKFNKFFSYIKSKELSQNELLRKNIINSRLLNALRNNKSITTDSLNKLCNNLNCQPSDIMEYVPDNDNNQ